MAIVAQNLFSWQEVFAKSDLDRLRAVIKAIPDEELMKVLTTLTSQSTPFNFYYFFSIKDC